MSVLILPIIGVILAIAAIVFVLWALRQMRATKPLDKPVKPEQSDFDDTYTYREAKYAWDSEVLDWSNRNAQAEKKRDQSKFSLLIAAGVFLLGAGIVGSSFLTSVPTQNVGVVTSFGRPLDRNLGPGVHGKLPWHKVTDMDGTIQTINNTDQVTEDEKNGKNTEPDRRRGKVAVRLDATNATMYVESNLRWRIKKDSASTLLQEWKEFSKIDNGLIELEQAAALNYVLADYDPYVTTPTDKEALSKEVTDRLNAKVGPQGTNQIEIVSFSIIKVDFDANTQTRINQLQEEVANTKKALQKQATATAEATANGNLNKSLTPSILVNKCLDLIEKKSGPDNGVPASLNCDFLTGDGKDVVLTKGVN